MKRKIRILIYVIVVTNLIIFFLISIYRIIRLEANIEKGIPEVQRNTELSADIIGSISENETAKREDLDINDTTAREYSDFFSLRDADLEYIYDAAYEELKEVLGQVEWYPKFETGKEEELELHLQKYKELLLMEREYANPSNGEKATLDYLIARQINEPDGSYFYYDMEANHYYIYDFDGDGEQELCVEVVALVSISGTKQGVLVSWEEQGRYLAETEERNIWMF